MTVRAGRESRNAGSFPRKELPDRAQEHRFPADRYLLTNEALSTHTEILRLRLRMTRPAGRLAHNAGSFLRKELGEALRIGPKI